MKKFGPENESQAQNSQDFIQRELHRLSELKLHAPPELKATPHITAQRLKTRTEVVSTEPEFFVEGLVKLPKSRATKNAHSHAVIVAGAKYYFSTPGGHNPLREGDYIRFGACSVKGSRSHELILSTLQLVAPSGKSAGGFVYILSNKSMPGLLKIGHTNNDPETRASELSSATGVPTPFKVEWSVLVPGHPAVIERQVHIRLGTHSVGKEFFDISVTRASEVITACVRAMYPDAEASTSTVLSDRLKHDEAKRQARLETLAQQKSTLAEEAFKNSPNGRWLKSGSRRLVLKRYDIEPQTRAPSIVRRLTGSALGDFLNITIYGRARYEKLAWRVLISGRRFSRRVVEGHDLNSLPEALRWTHEQLKNLEVRNYEVVMNIDNELLEQKIPDGFNSITGRESVDLDRVLDLVFRNPSNSFDYKDVIF